MELMGVEDVGTLNQVIESWRMREAILVNEALHEHRISEIAEMIAARTGKSAAGAHRRAERLWQDDLFEAAGGAAPGAWRAPHRHGAWTTISWTADKTPKDEQGNYKFEELEALDLELFNRQLLDLMAGREVTLPRYNFRDRQARVGRYASASARST